MFRGTILGCNVPSLSEASSSDNSRSDTKTWIALLDYIHSSRNAHLIAAITVGIDLEDVLHGITLGSSVLRSPSLLGKAAEI